MTEEKTTLGEALKLQNELKKLGNVFLNGVYKLEIKILRGIAKIIGSW